MDSSMLLDFQQEQMRSGHPVSSEAEPAVFVFFSAGVFCSCIILSNPWIPRTPPNYAHTIVSWSKNTKKVYFILHEGYLGAVGPQS
jgi:hypothetical protein